MSMQFATFELQTEERCPGTLGEGRPGEVGGDPPGLCEPLEERPGGKG